MTARTKELTVGLVFFSTLAVLIVFTVIISDVNPLNPPKYPWVFFGNVAGLREGNVVRVSGFELGKVKKMKLRQKGILAQLALSPTVEIHPNPKIVVRSFSPLGGKYVDLERGDLAKPPIELSEKEPAEDADLADPHVILQGKTEPEFISEIADLAEKVKPLVVSAVANIRDVTEKVNTMQGTIGKLIGDPEMYYHLRNASKNLEETTDSVNRVLRKVDEGNGTLAKLVNDGRLYDVTVGTLAHAESITAKVDEGRGPVGALFNDDRMRDDLARTIRHIESILAAADDGRGTVGQIVRNDRLYKALSQALEDLSRISGQVAEAKGPLGVLISDEKAGENVRRTLASVDKISSAVAEGRGTVGRLFMDDRLVTEAERVVVEIRESVEDLREQAPINAFVSAVFSAF